MIRIAVSFLALAVLAGCGTKGGLARPDPMWGDERARVLEQRREEERLRREQTGEPEAESPLDQGAANPLPQPPR